jgi:hypothetical protein
MPDVFRCVFRVTVPVLICAAAACADRKSPVDPSSPQPSISSISPEGLQPADAPQTLTFAGAGFDAGVQLLMTSPDGILVTVPGTSLQGIQPTTFQATVVLSQTGTYTFMVRTAAGTTSPPLTIVVQPPGSALPVARVVTPATVPRSNQATLVSIQGTGFAPNASVMITDPTGMLMALTGAQLAQLSPTNVQFTFVFGIRGTYTLVVLNPNGDTANAVFVVVT